jgi:hypothetical protein
VRYGRVTFALCTSAPARNNNSNTSVIRFSSSLFSGGDLANKKSAAIKTAVVLSYSLAMMMTNELYYSSHYYYSWVLHEDIEWHKRTLLAALTSAPYDNNFSTRRYLRYLMAADNGVNPSYYCVRQRR